MKKCTFNSTTKDSIIFFDSEKYYSITGESPVVASIEQLHFCCPWSLIIDDAYHMS